MQKEMLFRIGNYTFSQSGQLLKNESHSHSLTHREAELLAYFCSNVGTILKRDDILNKVWGNDHFFSSRSLDVFISRLRKLLQSDPNVKIENIHNIGYRLVVDN
jgi:DNA-binding response OmpR family regulator